MGVKGLTTVVRNHVLSDVPYTPLADGTRVLIDGPGWAYYLLDFWDAGAGQCTTANPMSGPAQRDHGGDYSVLHHRVCAEVARMQKAGLVIEVYWDPADPPSAPFKARTKAKRQQQRKEEVFRYVLWV